MQAPSNFKHDFLKHFLLGLQANRDSSRARSLNEREIKLLADVAMALARGNGPNWSRSLIGKNLCNEFKASAFSPFLKRKKLIMKRKSFNSRLKVRRVIPRVLARRIVRRRTQVLKRIIPGAESLDGISLLSETLDYVVYLKAQANIMQRLTRAFGA